ncbi:uncharacterized protein BXZ73DRAFT_95297 [Epithele typhae]|uniref:uncharacterized protein n=1 Tax=Epithele typhae TaxID=378194 RepID=UPI0020087E37|nr:uncharacterized protein BXZ73DRAFT_95297 [Epithele typhae]KAH9945772.1 hypothetical protein BXZ73DRAFT_95297 [Epithele typhae]
MSAKPALSAGVGTLIAALLWPTPYALQTPAKTATRPDGEVRAPHASPVPRSQSGLSSQQVPSAAAAATVHAQTRHPHPYVAASGGQWEGGAHRAPRRACPELESPASPPPVLLR